MADETVIISSPGLVTWGSGTFGDGSYGGQELSLGLLQGTSTTTADADISVTGPGLNLTVNSVTLDIGTEPLVQGTQIDLIITSVTAKTTTILWLSLPPVLSPKRMRIHSAPVIAPLLRNQVDKNIITNTWFQTGHTQGIHTL